MSDNMLQAASIWAAPAVLPWGHSERSTDTTTEQLAAVLTDSPLYVSPAAAAQVLYYAQRDRQLSYRDLVVATYATLASYAAATVWNSNLPKLSVPAPVIYKMLPGPDGLLPGLPNLVLDRPSGTLSTPAPVQYIPSRGGVSSEIDADKSLYARDLLILEALARTVVALAPAYRPLIGYDPTWVVDNRWAFSGGLDSLDIDAATIGLQSPFRRETFTEPDKALATRDNFVASVVAQLNLLFRNPYEHARRLYLRVNGTDSREPESYVLISEDSEQRVFAAEPFFIGGSRGLRLVYNRQTGTVRWSGEFADQTHPARRIAWSLGATGTPNPLVFDGPTGQQVEVLRSAPLLYDEDTGYGFDVQQLRQKSRRFCFQDGRYENLFWKAFTLDAGDTLLGDATSASVQQALGTYDLGLSVSANGFDWTIPANIAAGQWRVTFMLRPWAVGAANAGTLGQRASTGTVCAGPCGANPEVAVACDLSNDPDIILTASFHGVEAASAGAFQVGRTEAVSFDFTLAEGAENPRVALQLTDTLTSLLALEVMQVDVAQYLLPAREMDATTRQQFSGWNLELLDRAEEHLQSLHRKMLGYPLVPDSRFVQGRAGQAITPFALDFNHASQFSYVGQGTGVILSQAAPVGTKLVFLGNAGQLPRVCTVVTAVTSGQPGYLTGQFVVVLNTSLGDAPESGRVFVYGTAAFSATGLPTDLAIDTYTGIISGTLRANLPTSEITSGRVQVIVNQLTYSQGVYFSVLNAQTASSHPDVPFNWTPNSVLAWMSHLEGVEPRLRTTARTDEQSDAKAFRIGKPGDVGVLPALVPEGLELTDTGEIIANYGPRMAQPVLRTFQAWMLEVGIYVAQNDWFGEVLPVDFVPVNLAPVANAGAAQNVTLANGTVTATLHGTVTDDGLPVGGSVTHAWTQAAGPDDAQISDPASLTPTVTLAQTGQYVFRLTASDGQLSSVDQVVVTVSAPVTVGCNCTLDELAGIWLDFKNSGTSTQGRATHGRTTQVPYGTNRSDPRVHQVYATDPVVPPDGYARKAACLRYARTVNGTVSETFGKTLSGAQIAALQSVAPGDATVCYVFECFGQARPRSRPPEAPVPSAWVSRGDDFVLYQLDCED